MDALIVKVVFLFFTLVNSQVCNETRSIFREVPETYQFSYIENYQETDCWLFCAVKTRQAVNVATRIVQRYENISINICCDGYVEDDSHTGNGLYCKPNCDPPCQNGFCRRPNECACDAGFTLDPLNHTCKPLCLQDCDVSECTRIPQCPLNDVKISSPVCTEPCVNATCSGPELCECYPGFLKTSDSVCEPQEYFCRHGKYLRSDRCLCDSGYKWSCGECQPICSNCEHGVCVSPEECQCVFGYAKSSNGKCEPYCSNGCSNGTCVSPDVCRCYPGWYMLGEDGVCIPHCDMHCENGECVAPNICECISGYEVDANEPKCVLTPLKKDCKGESEICSVDDDQKTTTDVAEKAAKTVQTHDVEIPDVTEKPMENVTISNVNAVTKQEIDETSSTTTEKREITKTTLNSHGLKSGNISRLPANWIYGIIAVAVFITLIILGIILNKCSKSKTSTDDADDFSLRNVL